MEETTTLTQEQATQAYQTAREAWHHVMRAIKLLGDLEQIVDAPEWTDEREQLASVRDSLGDYVRAFHEEEEDSSETEE